MKIRHRAKSVLPLGAAVITTLVFMATPASATILITSNVASTTAPTLDNSFGTLEFALNLGNGGALTRDGINFSNVNVTSATGNINFFTSAPFSVDGTATTNWSQTDLGDDLFQTFAYTGGSAALDLDITGLDAGRIYQIQLLFGDSRDEPANFWLYNETITATDSLSNTDTDTLLIGSPASANFVLLTIKVSGSTSFNLDMPATHIVGPHVAGIVLQSIDPVPEPSSLVLAALGLLSLGFVAWRRHWLHRLD